MIRNQIQEVEVVFDKKVVGNLPVLVSDEPHARRLGRLLIYLRISYENSLLFLQLKGFDDLLDRFRMGLGLFTSRAVTTISK